MKKVLGLVLELNPPHNGHQYFIDEAKKRIQPDVTIGILSTNFTMRGDIACLDKFTRTRLALEMGLDIVLELPFLAAMNSADYFAHHAISSLVDFQITDLAFGVELDNLAKLEQMKNMLKSTVYQDQIKEYLQTGLSYSSSSFKAIQALFSDDEIIEQFTLPNNTLGIQYLNALDCLNANVRVTLIKRIANNYFDEEATNTIASATAIRKLLRNQESVSDYLPSFEEQYVFCDLNNAYQKLYQFVQFILVRSSKEELQQLYTVNEGIENRLLSMVERSKTYDEFIANVQTKRYTINKIQRMLLHIVLNTPKTYQEMKFTYLRVLGFSPPGQRYIHRLPKDIKEQIFTSMKNRSDLITEYELKATKLYGLLTNQPSLSLEEYKIPIKKEKNIE